MTRLGVVFWGGLVLASGFATFNVKYAVQGIDDELIRARRQTIAEQQEIRVLTAEWAYLNQPDRLAELNRDFLQLAPMTTKQWQGRVDEIALRALPPGGTATAPPTMVAANPPAAAPSAASPPAATLAAAPPVKPLAAAPADTAVADARTAEPTGAKAPTAPAQADGGRAVDAQVANAASDGAWGAKTAAAALAEALRVLGVDAGQQTSPARLAKAAPVIAAKPADAQGAEANSGEARTADAVSGAARAADSASDGAALAEAVRVLGAGAVDAGGPTSRLRVAKANPASLDALISKIADTR